MIKRILKDFRDEGTFWKTLYRKVKCYLIGSKPELWAIKKYIGGVTLHVGCGREKLPFAINVDNLQHRTYTDWDVIPDVEADVLHLPFDDCSVDNILGKHIWEHCPQFEFLDEMYRVLKKGGRLAIIMPNLDYLGHVVYWRDPTHLWAESKFDTITKVLQTRRWRLVQFDKLDKIGYKWAYDIVLEKI